MARLKPYQLSRAQLRRLAALEADEQLKVIAWDFTYKGPMLTSKTGERFTVARDGTPLLALPPRR